MSSESKTFDGLSFLEKLRSLVLLQQAMLNEALLLASHGSIQRGGLSIACTLPEKSRKASAMLAMTAGQSLNAVLEFAGKEGIPVRDCYPIARSIVESFINAAYIVSSTDDVAERALRHVQFGAWYYSNRRFGTGAYEIDISSSPDKEKELLVRFSEFAKSKSWTSLSVPDRIHKVGVLNSNKAAARLTAAYGLIYYLSSEVIHGSLFGASYFYTGYLDEAKSEDSFLEGTKRQIEEILVGVLHAGCGYLAAFYSCQKIDVLVKEEQRLFDLVLEASTDEAKQEA